MNRFRDIFILTSGRVLVALTSIVSIKIFTTLLSPFEVGRLNIIFAVIGWFGLIFLVGCLTVSLMISSTIFKETADFVFL